MNLQDKVAIITGASKGIGKEISLKFGESGIKLVLAARNKALLTNLKNEIESKFTTEVLIIPTDITKENQVTNMVNKTIEKFKKIDILINNAGVGRFSRIDQFSIEDYNFIMDVNVKGVFLTTKYVVPHMIRRESGHIINISSIAGKNGFKTGTLYSASKHAIQGFTWSLREDLKEYKIKVTAICPGSVLTSFGGKSPDYVEWSIQPEDIAHACHYLVTESDFVNTAELIIKPRFNPRKIQ
ncbi:SDR family oxidoreductase [Candidatus Hodarchaeum mangrovi]